jgi:hypothetical protein
MIEQSWSLLPESAIAIKAIGSGDSILPRDQEEQKRRIETS